MTKRIFKLCSLLTVLMVLAGCGQKGPLYLPSERDTTEPTEATEDEAPSGHEETNDRI